MTIATTSNRNDYTGNGSTVAFAYTFKVLAASSLEVYVNESLQTSGYSVSGVGNASGGTVTFTTAPSTAAAVALVRNEPYTQTLDLVENDRFSAETLEAALDKFVILCQQVKELATRSLRFAAGSANAAAGVVFPTLQASRYPRVNADCSGFDLVQLLETTSVYVSPLSTQGDMIIGDDAGCQSRLALGSSVGQSLRVRLDGVRPGYVTDGIPLLTNVTDTTLGAGSVVALSTACDRAVLSQDVQTCLRVFLVNPASAGDDCQTFFVGPPLVRSVKSTGTILRGDWVRKSATAQAVETTAIGHQCDRRVPHGAFAVAVTDAAANVVDLVVTGPPERKVPRYGGLRLRLAADTDHDITVAIGACPSDESNPYSVEDLVVTTEFTKQLDAAWAVGTNAGGMFTGAAAASTCYHFFLIKNPTTGVVDGGWDIAATGANAPAGYVHKQRLASFLLDASANLSAFDQRGDEIVLDTPILSVDNVTNSTSAALPTLHVPSGIAVQAILHVQIEPVSTTQNSLYVSSPDSADVAPAVAATPLATVIGGSTTAIGLFIGGAQARVWTDCDAHVRTRASTASGQHSIAVLGYKDPAWRA